MKRRRLIISAVGVVVVLFSVVFFSGDQGLVPFYRTWRQMRNLRNELLDSRRMIDSLTVEIERLKNDTAYIERIAREKYGMAKKDETLYKFIEEK